MNSCQHSPQQKFKNNIKKNYICYLPGGVSQNSPVYPPVQLHVPSEHTPPLLQETPSHGSKFMKKFKGNNLKNVAECLSHILSDQWWNSIEEF